MQRHCNDNVKSVAPKPRIIERCAEPACNKMAQIDLAAVFKFVNNFADDPATAIGGDRSVKMNCAMGAVRTCERADNRTLKRFRASCTKRWNDADHFLLALCTKVLARRDYRCANRADWRVQERYDFPQGTKVSQGQPNLTPSHIHTTSNPQIPTV